MKKILTVTIFLISALTGTAFAMVEERIWPEFPDVEKGSYYENGVYNMQRLKVVSGYENGNFGPNDPVTRGQVATMLDRYNTNALGKLRQKNAYLNSLVCAQFGKEDNAGENYQIAWEELCGVKAE